MLDLFKGIKNYFTIFCKYGLLNDQIRIEASTLCQLNCPRCIKTTEGRDVLGSGYLKFADFKKFIDSHPEFRHIELSNYGEMLLNPELLDIVRYAHEKGIGLTANNGVNLNTINENMAEGLVKYGFRSMIVSIDGASEGVYKIYRRGGNFNTVIDNIKKM